MGYYTDDNDNLVYFDSDRGGRKTTEACSGSVKQSTPRPNTTIDIELETQTKASSQGSTS